MRNLLLAAVPLCFSAPMIAASLPDPNPAQVDEIIQKFAAKEAAFQQARGNYTYRQTARVQELDESGSPLGRWEEVSDIIFTPSGKRTERVVYAPVNRLERILLTPEDEQDLRDVQPFVLTSEDLPQYYIRYLGHEQIDEIREVAVDREIRSRCAATCARPRRPVAASARRCADCCGAAATRRVRRAFPASRPPLCKPVCRPPGRRGSS